MTEKIEKKVKGFRISSDSHTIVDKLIKDTGKDPGEWFEDLIQQIATNELVLDKSGVPADLRKHFGSDIAAIKDATNSITTLFVNQMNRIAVEKNNWNQFLQQKNDENEQKLAKLRISITELEQSIELKDRVMDDANSTILQLQNKVDGFDKLEAQLRKEIERIEIDNEKTSQEFQLLRDVSTAEKEKFYKDMDELKQQHKEEKDRLNQQIVDLVEQIKKVESVNEENRTLNDKVKELEIAIKQHDADYELKITRVKEHAELEKEKALLARERELRDQLYAQNREDAKELYEKIEKLQAENSRLQLEIKINKPKK